MLAREDAHHGPSTEPAEAQRRLDSGWGPGLLGYAAVSEADSSAPSEVPSTMPGGASSSRQAGKSASASASTPALAVAGRRRFGFLTCMSPPIVGPSPARPWPWPWPWPWPSAHAARRHARGLGGTDGRATFWGVHGSSSPASHAASSAIPALRGTEAVDALVSRLRGRRVVALVGAGCSTASGIPDYRGPETRRRARNPIQFQTFIGDDAGRQRYWARSVVGWPRFRAAQPNPAHRALAALEQAGAVRGLITQNVDRLHHAAGSERVVELHGALHEVICLSCRAVEPRDALQERLLALNPGWERSAAAQRVEQAPDGDAELPAELVAGFRVAACRRCCGVLKPKVVFFGENVPPDVTADAWSLFDEGEALLVVGSSLTVFSGYRFVRKAAHRGIPVAVVNLGPTRGDPLVGLRVDDRVEAVLPSVARALG